MKKNMIVGLCLLLLSSTISVTAQAAQEPPPPGKNEDIGKLAATSRAAYTVQAKTVTKKEQEYVATRQDESGIKVSNKGTLTLTKSMISTTGNTSIEENSNFYGLNAAILIESGSIATFKDCTISTEGIGANAIFSTGIGSTVTVTNGKIKTTADSARGLDATLLGTIYATNVEITTAGIHCAALATDRGKGTIQVTGGTMTTSGQGSPGIYSTGRIAVTDATISAKGAEGAVIEGKNEIVLTNTTVSGAKLCGVMLYQSFSGEEGVSRLVMTGGSLTALAGPAFYVTNTEANIELNHTKIVSASAILLQAGAGRWGLAGSNGGIVTITANDETLEGNILCDKISTVTMLLQNNSTLTGAINPENTTGHVALVLESGTIWNVTGNSYLATFADKDSSLSNIHDNGYMIYYDAALNANNWLVGKTYRLPDGGMLTPKKLKT